MPPDLAHDRRDGVGEEVALAARVEALERVEQAQRGDLLEVVGGLAAPGEAPGDVAGHGQEPVDQPLADAFAARVVVGESPRTPPATGRTRRSRSFVQPSVTPGGAPASRSGDQVRGALVLRELTRLAV